MSFIQDIRALENRIKDIVEDYVKLLYNENDVLAIGERCGKSTELYPLKDLVRKGNDSMPESYFNKISNIVNSWLNLS